MSAAAAAREREGVQERGGEAERGGWSLAGGGFAKERCRRRAAPAYCGSLRVIAACYGLLRLIEAFSGFLYQALIAEARRRRDARRPASAGRRRRLRRAPRSASHCGLLRFIAA